MSDRDWILVFLLFNAPAVGLLLFVEGQRLRDRRRRPRGGAWGSRPLDDAGLDNARERLRR